MLTLQNVIYQMKVLEESDKSGLKQRELTTIQNKYNFLNLMKLYLEHNPTREFVEKEQARIVNRITLIEQCYEPVQKSTLSEEKKHKKEFDKENGIDKLREQAKTLKFILNN